MYKKIYCNDDSLDNFDTVTFETVDLIVIANFETKSFHIVIHPAIKI